MVGFVPTASIADTRYVLSGKPARDRSWTHSTGFTVKVIDVDSLLGQIGQLLEAGEPLVLATILTHRGSTPRTSGAKMVVRADRRIIGTIGGGLVEAQVIERACAVFDTGLTVIEHFALDADQADGMDMICGGNLSVLLELVAADLENRQLFERLRSVLSKGMTGLVVTPIPDDAGPGLRPKKCLIESDGTVTGKRLFTAFDPTVLFSAIPPERRPTTISHEGRRLYLEPLATADKLVLFGAGHVSQSVARCAKAVGFHITVVDDRPEFANAERFAWADEIRVPGSFNNVIDAMAIDRHSYIVIVTRGHLHDRDLLGQALKTRAGYIGMIGSKRKRDAIYDSLLADGVSRTEINRVHSPIGLDIDAETPEEIAISIVAELIAVRASHRRPGINAIMPGITRSKG
jgi:xanthine dehydrogenase accessory factor